MGTLITITLYAPDAAAAKAAAAAAFQRIDALEDIMSDYQADSELMRLCDQPFGTPGACQQGPVRCPPARPRDVQALGRGV